MVSSFDGFRDNYVLFGMPKKNRLIVLMENKSKMGKKLKTLFFVYNVVGKNHNFQFTKGKAQLSFGDWCLQHNGVNVTQGVTYTFNCSSQPKLEGLSLQTDL